MRGEISGIIFRLYGADPYDSLKFPLIPPNNFNEDEFILNKKIRIS